jgi:hypothetical protein
MDICCDLTHVKMSILHINAMFTRKEEVSLSFRVPGTYRLKNVNTVSFVSEDINTLRSIETTSSGIKCSSIYVQDSKYFRNSVKNNPKTSTCNLRLYLFIYFKFKWGFYPVAVILQ